MRILLTNAGIFDLVPQSRVLGLGVELCGLGPGLETMVLFTSMSASALTLQYANTGILMTEEVVMLTMMILSLPHYFSQQAFAATSCYVKN